MSWKRPRARASGSPLWRSRDFLVFWGGQSFSQVGSRITGEAIPLAAVITLGASPMMMGWIQVVSSLPVIALGLVVGVLMDRFRRRPFLITADILRFLVLLIIPLAALTGWLHMWVLFVTSAITASLGLIFTAAYESYLPGLVGRGLLVDANTKISITQSGAEIIGPGLAGVLVQAITAPMAVLIDSFTYLCSAISIWAIRKPEPARPKAAKFETSIRETQTATTRNQASPPPNVTSPTLNQPSSTQSHPSPTQSQKRQFANLLKDIREGLWAIHRSPVLRALTLMSATSSVFAGIVFTMDVLFAIRTLHLGPALFGFTVMFGGIGAIIGASVAQPLIRRFGYGPLLVVSGFLKGVGAWLIPLAHGQVWMATAFLIGAQLFGDLFGVIFGVMSSSLRQTITHDEVLGRVNTTVNLITSVLGPLGALLGAGIATAFNLRIAMAVGVAGMTVSACWLLIQPILTMQTLPPEPKT